jgi:ribosome biogenesis GTPase
VVASDVMLECYLPANLAAVQQSEIAPGDRVRFSVKDDGSRMIHSVLPRTTFLARPDPHNARRQRVIAANIDIVVNVVSVKSPPLRPRLIDRYLIAITEGGAKPVVCVNKVDLLGNDALREELRCLDVYRDLGVVPVLCSTRDGRGLDKLLDALRGGTSVFVGHSGVGKSTILKRLVHSVDGAEVDLDGIRTAEVSQRYGTGRHTTRLATMYELGGGTAIIDTPGIREFGLWNLDDETLRSYFPEFEAFEASCKFNDCSHSHEPNCAVKDAAAGGHIAAARLDTYLRIREELKEQGELK